MNEPISAPTHGLHRTRNGRARTAVARGLLLAGVLAWAAKGQAAAVVDVNSVATGTALNGLVQAGFQIESRGPAWVANTSFCLPACADNGSNFMFSLGATLSLRSTGGGSFSLQQFDGAEGQRRLPLLWARDIVVRGETVGGDLVSASFALDRVQDASGPQQDFQTFVLPDTFSNLSRVTFIGMNGGLGINFFSLDNLMLTPSPVGPPLPAALPTVQTVAEPGAWGLALLALGAVVMFTRRPLK